jgi:hypothetical protein
MFAIPKQQLRTPLQKGGQELNKQPKENSKNHAEGERF